MLTEFDERFDTGSASRTGTGAGVGIVAGARAGVGARVEDGTRDGLTIPEFVSGGVIGWAAAKDESAGGSGGESDGVREWEWEIDREWE